MTTRTRIAVRHLAIATILVALVVWLWRLGNDEPTIPTSLDAVAAWIDRHDAVTLAFALVRLEALVLAVYLLALTGISAVVRVLALPRATRLIDSLTLPVIRGVFGGAAALGVMAVPGPVHRPAQAATTSTVVSAPTEDPTAEATLHLVVPGEQPPAPEAPVAPVAPAAPITPAPDPVPVPADIDTWVVQPGDSLWSIAASHLADVNGTPPTDADVVVMWQRLIDLNRERLVNPDEPDLIFADQIFELPAMETG